MPSYATPADVAIRYDIRMICQKISDTGSAVATGSIGTNAVLLALIADASNKVLTACRVADRYKKADLDAVYANADRSPQLVNLVCDLTFGYIVARRGLSVQELFAQAPKYKEALEMLEQLKIGTSVFDDAPPVGDDAPHAGANVELVATIPATSNWSNRTRLFPEC